ncbi:MAG: M16 family metallopeptidase, partial [Candidatus Kapaibacteriota bacterium]
ERKHNKLLFHNSKYAIHDIIGDTNILRNASYDLIKRFYKDWYRPDLMAVIAVGDFDVDQVEKLIKDKFSVIPKAKKPRKREYVSIPSHKDVFVSVATDKELSFPRVGIYFKGGKIEQSTFRNYRDGLLSQIFSNMFNQRLKEYLRKENPPFKFFAVSGLNPLGRLNSVYVMFAGAIGNAIDRCIETLLTEAFRVLQHGFTPSEFERAKKEILRQYESQFNERDKSESIFYALEYSRNFLQGEGIPGIDYEYELVKKWLPEIQLDEVNALSKKFINKENVLIAVSAPERPDVIIPNEENVKQMFFELSEKALAPYVDVTPTKPLFDRQVTNGKIIKERYLRGLDATELELNNGAKVVLKKTDFKNEEVVFHAYSFGGASLVAKEDYYNAVYCREFITESGVGK